MPKRPPGAGHTAGVRSVINKGPGSFSHRLNLFHCNFLGCCNFISSNGYVPIKHCATHHKYVNRQSKLDPWVVDFIKNYKILVLRFAISDDQEV